MKTCLQAYADSEAQDQNARMSLKYFFLFFFFFFFFFFCRKRNLTLHAVVFSRDNAHDISKPVFWENLETVYLKCQNRFSENISANAQTDLNLRWAHV